MTNVAFYITTQKSFYLINDRDLLIEGIDLNSNDLILVLGYKQGRIALYTLSLFSYSQLMLLKITHDLPHLPYRLKKIDPLYILLIKYDWILKESVRGLLLLLYQVHQCYS